MQSDKIEPVAVAWMYQWRTREPVFFAEKRYWSNNSDWTETPLVPAEQLADALREVEKMREALTVLADPATDYIGTAPDTFEQHLIKQLVARREFARAALGGQQEGDHRKEAGNGDG